MNLGQQMKQKFLDEGHVLPSCVNSNCTRPVMVRDWKNWSIKSECGTCYKARVSGFVGSAMAGITIHKKEFCENVDGRLGWKCPVPSEAWKNLDGTDFQAYANDIIEWDGAVWSVLFNSTNTKTVTYVNNTYTGIQYKWDNSNGAWQWSKSFEGIYESGAWRLVL